MATVTTPNLRTDPARYLEAEIKRFILESPDNRLKNVDGSPMFDEPLVGFADGDDKLFRDYKTIIGEFHLTPKEVLQQAAGAAGDNGRRVSEASVVSWILPIAQTARLANRAMAEGPCLAWNNVRWHGQELSNALARHVVTLIEQGGYRAVAPDQASFFAQRDLPNGRASNWSHRHVAYVAGLGTFSLTDGFITPRGIAMRTNSVVTDLKLPPSPRRYASHVANCPFLVDGSCGACIKRCPAGALSAKGHDKLRCREYMTATLRPWLQRPGYGGSEAGCGLCQTKVPCEDRIPPM